MLQNNDFHEVKEKEKQTLFFGSLYLYQLDYSNDNICPVSQG